MADKNIGKSGSGMKPVPMKLIASWEMEKTSPNCIPRQCSLTLTRLVVTKPLENDLTSLLVAVKMQSSKRVLRSNEIVVPQNGVLDTELDLYFSLPYPHFMKRDGNKLQILLQRRKKYKNRTILGYKTLAVGQVSMAQVLQCSISKELNLYSDLKERTNVAAQVMVIALSSQPVDHEENGHRKLRTSDVENYTDDEDAPYNDPEYSSNDELSDSEPMMLEEDGRSRPRKTGRLQFRPLMSSQRNFKQKFVALLKRFKVTDEVLDSEPDQELVDTDQNPQDIDDLFEELENLSDSEPDLDTLSVISTPKPSLRPFFTGKARSAESPEMTKSLDSGSKLQEDIPGASIKRMDSEPHMEIPEISITTTPGPEEYVNTGLELNEPLMPTVKGEQAGHTAEDKKANKTKSPPVRSKFFSRERSLSYREKKSRKEIKSVQAGRRYSTGATDHLPRKALLDQLKTVVGENDDKLPESVILVNNQDYHGQILVQRMQEKPINFVCTCSSADVKAALCCLVNKIQKFCHSNSKSPKPIKVGIAGTDGYVNSVLRPYLDLFSNKSPDWQTYIRFLVIPFGASNIAKYLGSIDNVYNSLFLDNLWKETFEKTDQAKLDQQELFNRLSKYMSSANSVAQIPIAEAMVTIKGKGTDEESSQIFLPFISEVKIGTPELLNTSVDFEEGMISPPALSGSPPGSCSGLIEKAKEGHTPPSSPSVNTSIPILSPATPSSSASSPVGEYMELQVDYWMNQGKPDTGDKDKVGKKDSNKCSLKSAFRSLHVSRFPPTSDGAMPMVIVTKEKKQKIMRLGKKSKDVESKREAIDGICRLICTSKSQNNTLKVTVDGNEWTGVKFFQLSPQWQTHIKHFPVAIFGHSETPC
ncbi:phosphofurin acidic cluster sorting protein 2-like isoform X2 [Liolophura sinensis]|uniref:phosphofurin acidic cluster sorting protein 2-like isoform X2 n=1 Tax=Liolophura sinensis TaxID=3198878 RepID=UPI00315955B7